MSPGHPSFDRGTRLFDRGSFFEAHEAWEELWRGETDPRKRLFLQGLIQIAAGFHKLFVVGSPESATRLLGRGLSKLDGLSTEPAGVDLGALRDGVNRCIQSLRVGQIAQVVAPRIGLK